MDSFGLGQIGQIALTVSDLERAVGFYRDQLGLRFLFQFPGLALFTLASISAGWGPAAHGAETEAPAVRLLVPAYFYPAGEGLEAWQRLFKASSRVPVVAIVNPASGPGPKADDNYRRIMVEAKPTKITLVGYVTLGYAKRPAADVKAEVDAWIRLYPEIRGIFFDEQPSGAEHSPFAAECFAHARKQIAGGLVFSNPGTNCAEEYYKSEALTAGCLYEGNKGFDDVRLPDWARSLRADRVVMLLYEVKTKEQMQARFAEALRKRAGYLYLTDATGANPWDRLPSYWDAELEAVLRANAKQK